MAKLGAKPGWNENYIQTITEDTTLYVADSGKVICVATDALTITLPACEAGLKFTFVNTGADANNIIRTNAQTISDNTTIAANKNGFTAGPITISSGTSVTISSGANWKIV